MKVEILNKSPYPLPEYATNGSAGLDLQAHLPESVLIYPGGRRLVPTGLFLQIPTGYEAQIRPRSGMALKNGISIPNAPGTIDSDFRGEVMVILINLGTEPVRIEPGDRIAQIVFARVEQCEWEQKELTPTTRKGGFGSTGK